MSSPTKPSIYTWRAGSCGSCINNRALQNSATTLLQRDLPPSPSLPPSLAARSSPDQCPHAPESSGSCALRSHDCRRPRPPPAATPAYHASSSGTRARAPVPGGGARLLLAGPAAGNPPLLVHQQLQLRAVSAGTHHQRRSRCSLSPRRKGRGIRGGGDGVRRREGRLRRTSRRQRRRRRASPTGSSPG